MKEFFTDPVFLTAAAAFSGAVLPRLADLVFKKLESLSGKTKNKVDDALVKALAEAVNKKLNGKK